MRRFRVTQKYVSERVEALDVDKAQRWPDESYTRSYPHMVALFNEADIDERRVVQGAHMAYGWMPTILNINQKRLADAVSALCQLRRAEDVPLEKDHWRAIADAVNNSLVGASKLAHFVAPDRAAIWDSRVIKYLVKGYASTARSAIQRRAPAIDTFLHYQSGLRAARGTETARRIQMRVSERLGYGVSELRAMELTMYSS